MANFQLVKANNQNKHDLFVNKSTATGDQLLFVRTLMFLHTENDVTYEVYNAHAVEITIPGLYVFLVKKKEN